MDDVNTTLIFVSMPIDFCRAVGLAMISNRLNGRQDRVKVGVRGVSAGERREDYEQEQDKVTGEKSWSRAE